MNSNSTASSGLTWQAPEQFGTSTEQAGTSTGTASSLSAAISKDPTSIFLWNGTGSATGHPESTLRFAGGEGAQRRSGQSIIGTRPKSRTPKDRAFSDTHMLPLPPAEETQAAGKRRVSGKVQARPRTGSGGAGQAKVLCGKGIRQASGGEVESTRVARKATPARGKALGRRASAATRPNPESG